MEFFHSILDPNYFRTGSVIYRTRIRIDSAKAMCADIRQLVRGVRSVGMDIGLKCGLVSFANWDGGDYLLGTACSEEMYGRFAEAVEKKFPGLCEFDVSAEC